eukprot:scaffold1623_cov165-Ochromonas_danica.AAC.16
MISLGGKRDHLESRRSEEEWSGQAEGAVVKRLSSVTNSVQSKEHRAQEPISVKQGAPELSQSRQVEVEDEGDVLLFPLSTAREKRRRRTHSQFRFGFRLFRFSVFGEPPTTLT